VSNFVTRGYYALRGPVERDVETWHMVQRGDCMTLEVRLLTPEDVPVVVTLLTSYMKETFDKPWGGTAEALVRDGFGAEMETMLAWKGVA